MIVRKEM